MLRNIFGACRKGLSTSPLQLSKNLADRPDPHLIKYDYIGPPDKDSNIRPFVRCIPIKGSKYEMELRKMQIEVEEWNQVFWSRHNKRFYDEKLDFIRAHNLAGTQEISADKMSDFYKTFLDKNRKLHILYNFSWYLKNFQILLLAFRVKVVKMLLLKKTYAK